MKNKKHYRISLKWFWIAFTAIVFIRSKLKIISDYVILYTLKHLIINVYACSYPIRPVRTCIQLLLSYSYFPVMKQAHFLDYK